MIQQLAVGVLEVTLVVIDRRVVGRVEELHFVAALLSSRQAESSPIAGGNMFMPR